MATLFRYIRWLATERIEMAGYKTGLINKAIFYF